MLNGNTFATCMYLCSYSKRTCWCLVPTFKPDLKRIKGVYLMWRASFCSDGLNDAAANLKIELRRTRVCATSVR